MRCGSCLQSLIALTACLSCLTTVTRADERRVPTDEVRNAATDTPQSSADGVRVRILRSDDLTRHSDDQPTKSTMLEVTFAPQAASMPHRHPGAVCGYVLEGVLQFQIGDRPLRTLKAGDTFFEPAMILHRVARNPDSKQQTRILVTMIHPATAEKLVIPEPGAESVGPDTTR